MIVDGFDAIVKGVCAKACIRNVTRDGGVGERIFLLGSGPHDLKTIGVEYLQWNELLVGILSEEVVKTTRHY